MINLPKACWGVISFLHNLWESGWNHRPFAPLGTWWGYIYAVLHSNITTLDEYCDLTPKICGQNLSNVGLPWVSQDLSICSFQCRYLSMSWTFRFFPQDLQLFEWLLRFFNRWWLGGIEPTYRHFVRGYKLHPWKWTKIPIVILVFRGVSFYVSWSP